MNQALSFLRKLRIWKLTPLMAVLTAPLWAQSTGRLVGTVRDPSGAAVADALVSLFRPGMTEPAVQTKTTSAGLFEFGALPPESYRVTIEKAGFKLYELTDITLSPGTETPLSNIELTLGPQGSSVLVPGTDVVSVQTSNAEVATTLTTAQLEDLPILNRDPLGLVPTQAGVVSGAGGTYTTIDGLRASFSNITLDGVNVQDNLIRYNGLNITANGLHLGEVNQFTLVTSNQAAIYGSGATQTAFVSPSGNNALHGSVFYLNSSNPLNANQWFQAYRGLTNEYKSNEAGFTLGGPLLKQKLFGYLAYEFTRRPNSIGESAFTLTSSERQDIAQLGITINPVVASILRAIPAPNVSTDIYQHAELDQADLDNVIGRLDYVPSQRSTFVASYLWNRQDVDLLDGNGDPSLYGNRFAVRQRANPNLISGSWRFMPTPYFTNEMRVGLNLAPIDFVNAERTLPYFVNLGPFQFLNPVSTFQDNGRRTNTYDFQDNASYSFGRHNLQFGFQVQLIRADDYLQNDSVPMVYLGIPPKTCYPTSTSISTTCILAVLQGQYYGISQHFFPVNAAGQFGATPERNKLRLDNYAPYVQDNWKVTRNLSFTFGLRYDFYTVLNDSLGRFYAPQLVGGNVNATFAATNPTYSPLGDNLYHADHNNLAPSVGVAFDPAGRGRTVFRASYGISYVNDDFLEAQRFTLSANTYNLGYGFTLVPGTLPNLNPIAIPAGGSGIPYPFTHPVLGVIDPNLRTPYVQQWSAGVQQEMSGFIFDLRYVGNHAAKLQRQDEFAVGNNIVYYLGNTSSSTYNALQFDVSRRLRSGLQVQANYTYSKVLTDSNTFASTFVDPYRDPADHRLDRGPAVFDVRNAFKTNLVYELPFHGDSAFTRAALGGWSVSAIMVAQSGLPFSIINGTAFGGHGTQTASTTLTGSALDQVIDFNITGNGPSIIAPQAIAKNTTANPSFFFNPPQGQPGTLQPRSFYSPASFDLDFGLQKRFHITERQTLELRGVAVNVFNHPSFGFYDQNINLGGFGLNAYTVYAPRTLQLSAYYRF